MRKLLSSLSGQRGKKESLTLLDCFSNTAETANIFPQCHRRRSETGAHGVVSRECCRWKTAPDVDVHSGVSYLTLCGRWLLDRTRQVILTSTAGQVLLSHKRGLCVRAMGGGREAEEEEVEGGVGGRGGGENEKIS